MEGFGPNRDCILVLLVVRFPFLPQSSRLIFQVSPTLICPYLRAMIPIGGIITAPSVVQVVSKSQLPRSAYEQDSSAQSAIETRSEETIRCITSVEYRYKLQSEFSTRSLDDH